MIVKYNKKISLISNLTFKYVISILITVFIIGFVLGVFGIRYGYVKNSYYFLKDLPSRAQNLYNTIGIKGANFQVVSIDMKFDEYQKILNNRDRNINEGHAVYGAEDWTKGKISFSNIENQLRAKFRLKGTMSDNWISPDGKWSFRIKLRDDKRFRGMKEFSLFPPNVASGPLEWLFQIISKEKGLITLKTDIVKLYFNGKPLGYYYLQEHFGKELIESNERREGPIVGYGKERLIKIWGADPKNILNVNGYNVSNLKITGNYNKLKTHQKTLSNYALGMLDKLRNRQEKPSNLIDVDSLSKLLAIRAILGSSELDWKDIKFYYNPLSSKLEPVVRELHADYDLIDWWYRGTRQLNTVKTDHTTFEDIIFSDNLIYERYIYFLRKFISEKLIQNVKQSNKSEYLKIMGALASSNNGQKWLEAAFIRQNKIEVALAYPDPISINLLDGKYLNVRNYQSFPVIIRNIKINGKNINDTDLNIVIQGKINQEKFYETLLIDKPIIGLNDDFKIEVLYSLFGDTKIKNTNVENFSIKFYQTENLDNYKKYFIEKNGELHNKQLETIINETVITPKDIKVKIFPGSKIEFKSNGQLIALGGISLNGEKDSRIIIKSSEDASSGGIFVSESEQTSFVQYTDFENLKGVILDNRLITGCINFFKSNVIIKNSTFHNNFNKDDFINIINSEFEIEDVIISNSFADAIDLDFSDGSMKNIKIYNPGNDGIDFSGSNVVLSKVIIKNSKDKALSVGENSKVNASSIIINNSFIGIAVKDGSKFIANISEMKNNKFDYASFIKKVEYGSPMLRIDNGPKNFNYILGDNASMNINGKLYKEKTAEITTNIRDLLYN